MANYITIDGGTTNTRISLVCDGVIKETVKINIGACKSIDGSEPLRRGIKSVISDMLANNGLIESDVRRILASGMITSEFGLCNLEHMVAPAGIFELSRSTCEVVLDDISSIPFVFVRGVKTVSDDIAFSDMMRGEETELMGIMDLSYGECVYVLPGSHSKIVRCDNDGRITDFSTLLTGEMIGSIAQNTILKDAVDLSLDKTDTSYLMKGYNYSVQYGINNALFKVRVLKNLFGATADEIYSFYMGAVLQGEIKQILSYNAPTVVVGGRKQLKEAIAHILSSVTSHKVIVIDDEIVDKSVVRGVIKIYEQSL